MPDSHECRGHLVRCTCAANAGDAVELHFSVRVLRSSAAPVDGAPRLSARELEVARLIAAGASNRDIADAFVLSPRTIDTHVSHILRKLGLASRAQIAAWVVNRQRPFTLVAGRATGSAA